jgi:hypothetical protein
MNQRTKISIDAPEHFFDPHRSASDYYRRTGTQPAPLYSLTRVGTSNGSRKQPLEENAHVLPCGSDLLKTTKQFKKDFPTSYGKSASRVYPHGKQVRTVLFRVGSMTGVVILCLC